MEKSMSYFYKTESPKLPDTEITMTTAIDLFAGLGGWSTGARRRRPGSLGGKSLAGGR